MIERSNELIKILEDTVLTEDKLNNLAVYAALHGRVDVVRYIANTCKIDWKDIAEAAIEVVVRKYFLFAKLNHLLLNECANR